MSNDAPAPTDSDFPPPPRTIGDAEDRTVELREGTEADFEAIVAMYVEFDPADRAQGIPPSQESGIRDWLETIQSAGSLTVVAEREDDLVGHGMLVPDGEDAYELALFVLQDYQGVGIGTALLRTLLGLGQERAVARVWLSVERWNEAAIHVYRKVGFEQTGSASYELEMAMDLQAA